MFCRSSSILTSGSCVWGAGAGVGALPSPPGSDTCRDNSLCRRTLQYIHQYLNTYTVLLEWFRAIYWIPCYILDSVLYIGFRAIYWIPCYILDSLLYIGFRAIYWIPCYILDSVLYIGFRAIYWILCYILDSVLYIGFRDIYWMLQ